MTNSGGFNRCGITWPTRTTTPPRQRRPARPAKRFGCSTSGARNFRDGFEEGNQPIRSIESRSIATRISNRRSSGFIKNAVAPIAENKRPLPNRNLNILLHQARRQFAYAPSLDRIRPWPRVAFARHRDALPAQRMVRALPSNSKLTAASSLIIANCLASVLRATRSQSR